MERHPHMSTELARFDAAEYLASEEAQADFLSDALSSGDHGYIAHAIGVVARARGMTDLAEKTGIKRQQLYRAFDKDGNPTLETVTRVLGAMDIKLVAVPA
jgi:probable addiction module antidote protein